MGVSILALYVAPLIFVTSVLGSKYIVFITVAV